jgi:hypothetical protein
VLFKSFHLLMWNWKIKRWKKVSHLKIIWRQQFHFLNHEIYSTQFPALDFYLFAVTRILKCWPRASFKKFSRNKWSLRFSFFFFKWICTERMYLGMVCIIETKIDWKLRMVEQKNPYNCPLYSHFTIPVFHSNSFQICELFIKLNR